MKCNRTCCRCYFIALLTFDTFFLDLFFTPFLLAFLLKRYSSLAILLVTEVSKSFLGAEDNS